METYTIKLSEQHVGVIASVLAEIPYKVAAPILTDIERQVSEQRDPQKKEAKS